MNQKTDNVINLSDVIDSKRPRLGELFHLKGEPDIEYRVTAFLKPHTIKDQYLNPDIQELMSHIQDIKDAHLTPLQRKKLDKKIQVVLCTRNEAEFVQGMGIDTRIVRIKDIVVTGSVKWNKELLEHCRDRYNKLLHENYLPSDLYKYWKHE